MRRALLPLVLLLAAACEDEVRELRLVPRVNPDGATEREVEGGQELHLRLGTAGIYGLQATFEDDDPEPRRIGIPAAWSCGGDAVELLPVVDEVTERGVQDELHLLALVAVRPGVSCVAVDSTHGKHRARVVVTE